MLLIPRRFPRWAYRLGRIALSVSVLAAALFIALPLFALMWRAGQVEMGGKALNQEVSIALILSLRTTLISLTIIIALGTPLAYVLARYRFFGKRWLNALVEVPIVLPPAVAGLALLVTFGRRGILGEYLTTAGIQIPFTMVAVILAQTFVAMPFYIRAVQIGFQQIDPDLEDAALVDGANRMGRFFYITLPLSSRALLNGILLSWARALGEFGATILFAGSLQGQTRTMPLLVYHRFESDLNAAIWTALILVGLAIGVALITRFLLHEERPR